MKRISRAQRRALAFGQVTSAAAILRGLLRAECLLHAEEVLAGEAIDKLDHLGTLIRAGFAPREDS